MNMQRFINRHYQVEELFGVVELAVAQLVEETVSDDLKDRQQALMRLLLLIREQEEENYSFYILDKAISHAFQHVPQYDEAIKDYLKGLTNKGKKPSKKGAKG